MGSNTKKVLLTEGDGKKKVNVRFKDKANNITEPVSSQITLDTKGPTNTSVTINDGAEYTGTRSIFLQLKAEGATEMFINGDVVDDAKTYQWIPYSSKIQVDLIEGDGKKTVRVSYRSSEGNASKPAERTIILDTTPPDFASVSSFDASNTEA